MRNMQINKCHTIHVVLSMGDNKRFLQSKFYMEEMNVYEMCKHRLNSASDERQTIINDLCKN